MQKGKRIVSCGSLGEKGKSGKVRKERKDHARVCISKLCAKAYRKLPPVVESQSDGSASMRHDGKGNAVLKMLHVASLAARFMGDTTGKRKTRIEGVAGSENDVSHARQ